MLFDHFRSPEQRWFYMNGFLTLRTKFGVRVLLVSGLQTRRTRRLKTRRKNSSLDSVAVFLGLIVLQYYISYYFMASCVESMAIRGVIGEIRVEEWCCCCWIWSAIQLHFEFAGLNTTGLRLVSGRSTRGRCLLYHTGYLTLSLLQCGPYSPR